MGPAGSTHVCPPPLPHHHHHHQIIIPTPPQDHHHPCPAPTPGGGGGGGGVGGINGIPNHISNNGAAPASRRRRRRRGSQEEEEEDDDDDDDDVERNVDHSAATVENLSISKPPRTVIRHCNSSAYLPEPETEIQLLGLASPENPGYEPVFRSGSYSDKGPKQNMEDEYICVDDLHDHIPTAANFPSPAAFYGVFDGHGGRDAALYTRKNILTYIVEDSHFRIGTKRAVRNAFAKTDHELADAKCVDKASGTTALTALILGRTMLIANAGDSRAVLGKRGRAIELSKDHKPNSTSERLRIERMGGVIYDGYLNGQLSVARALGDWELKGSKGSKSPLSAEPEMEEMKLTEEDEYLIIGCDGLWDVMSSQCAVTMVRKELMNHNDPHRCSKVLVNEALRRNTCDNLTVVVVCFSAEPPPSITIPASYKRRSISAEGLDHLKGLLLTN